MKPCIIDLGNGLILEYSITGKGPPIVVFHGGHSNCREEFGYQALLQSGYSIITPSRAGYGRTSAGIGSNLPAACHAYVKLMDHLGIEKADIIAVSAGGPSGIYFAAHYPERVKSLTLQSAVSKEWITVQDKTYKISRVIFHPSCERYTWSLVRLMNNRFPRFFFKQMASSFSLLPYSEVEKFNKEDDIHLLQRMNNRQRSGHGFMLDLTQTGAISDADLQAIQCPTLIQHSKHDKAVPFEHALHANRHIAGSKLCALDTWGHLIWLGKGAETVNLELLEFLHNS